MSINPQNLDKEKVDGLIAMINGFIASKRFADAKLYTGDLIRLIKDAPNRAAFVTELENAETALNHLSGTRKLEETAAGAFFILMFIPLFFFFCLWLFWPSSKGVSRNTEVGNPHTWPGYDHADHSNDCPRCGAKLDLRTDQHDCDTLQKMNRAEGWIDGIYGGRRAQDL